MREERLEDHWQFARLQPTMLSPSVMLTQLERNLNNGLNSGIYCLGPSDPWDIAVSANTDPAIYWLPAIIYESASSGAREMLHAQVSNCPLWAFSMPIHPVRYLVHDLL